MTGVGQMASQSDDTDEHRGNVAAPFSLKAHFRDRALVMRPVGDLTPKTYERLRDGRGTRSDHRGPGRHAGDYGVVAHGVPHRA
jgi:hypothetical protein